MTDYPIHDAPDRMAQTDFDALSADAANWRELLARLARRGFAEMSLADILDCFPDFGQVTLAHPGPSTLPGPVHAGVIADLRYDGPIDVRDFAEAVSPLGMVNIGYTVSATDAGAQPMLAFTFLNTNAVYLRPIVSLLNELIATIIARPQRGGGIIARPQRGGGINHRPQSGGEVVERRPGRSRTRKRARLM